jgi:hypothetical protein
MRNRHCAAAAPPLVSSPYMRRLSNESGQADVLRGAILRNLVEAAGTPPRARGCVRVLKYAPAGKLESELMLETSSHRGGHRAARLRVRR